MPAKFTVYWDKANKFCFNLKGPNGEIIVSCEGYSDKKSALEVIDSIVLYAPKAKIEDITNRDYSYYSLTKWRPPEIQPPKFVIGREQLTGSKYYFCLYVTTGKGFFGSVRYPDIKSARKAIAHIVKYAPKAKIEDTAVEIPEIKPAKKSSVNKPVVKKPIEQDIEFYMNQDFITIIKKLVAEQGRETMLNPSKCKAYLADYTKGEYKMESHLLLQALDAGVQKAIDTTENFKICKQQQIKILQDNYSIAENRAAEVVNTLALILRGDKS
jgi:uncharacterized protein YegP (UPF0339 family)